MICVCQAMNEKEFLFHNGRRFPGGFAGAMEHLKPAFKYDL
jgi:hypothetical protein